MVEKIKTKIKKGDVVEVISGKESGKSGKIIRIDLEKGRCFIEGVNLVKKAMRKKKQNDKGGIVEIEGSLDLSNVMIKCKKCGPTRVGFKVDADKKLRVCRKCGEVV